MPEHSIREQFKKRTGLDSDYFLKIILDFLDYSSEDDFFEPLAIQTFFLKENGKRSGKIEETKSSLTITRTEEF